MASTDRWDGRGRCNDRVATCRKVSRSQQGPAGRHGDGGGDGYGVPRDMYLVGDHSEKINSTASSSYRKDPVGKSKRRQAGRLAGTQSKHEAGYACSRVYIDGTLLILSNYISTISVLTDWQRFGIVWAIR